SPHPPTPDIYTRPLHDALPISPAARLPSCLPTAGWISALPSNVVSTAWRLTGKSLLSIGAALAPAEAPGPWTAIGFTTITPTWTDRESTRLNSSHVKISYAVFC